MLISFRRSGAATAAALLLASIAALDTQGVLLPQAAVAGTAPAVAGTLLAQAATDARLPAQDRSFLAAAARDSAGQVQLGRLAAETTGNTQVQEFATRMVNDHRRVGTRLKELGVLLDVSLPDRPTLESQEAFDRLDGLTGPAFDRAYMEVMIKDRETAFALYAKEQRSGGNDAVRAFAEETLPVMQAHLEDARGIAANLPPS